MSTQTGQVLTCRQTKCAISRHPNQATVLLRMPHQLAGLPACDDCARHMYETYPVGHVELSPLSEYVDTFAAAKQAMNATPGQVISGQSAARQTWDTGEPVITRAPVAQAGNGFTAEERAARSGRSGTLTPPTARAWWIAAGSGLFGIVFCIGGAPDGTQIESQPNGPLLAVGIVLILTAIVVAATAALKIARIKARQYAAWKATLSPEDRRAVEVAELAAMAAGAYAVHEGLKHHSQRSAERIATMRGHMEAARHLNDGRDQQLQQDQMAADLSRIASQGGSAPDFMTDPQGYLNQRRGY